MKPSKWFAVGFTLGGLLTFLDKKNRDLVRELVTNLIAKVRKEN